MAGLRRALLVVTTTAVLVLPAACSSDTGADPGRRTTPGAPVTSGSPAAEDTVDHTVAAPGPRQPGLLAPADILVVASDTIDAATIKKVQALKGVTALPIALSQPLVEDQAITVAAVDPAAYRTFTPPTPSGADFQEAWDRVANGEAAIKSRLEGKLPVSKDDYLRLGSATDAPSVHVGAYVSQQPLVDAVVNPTWIPTLGMTPDNALLVRTGSAAPSTVQKKLEALLPKDTAVTLVDKATREGVDPGAVQVAVVTGSVADAVGVYKYTVLGGGHIAPDPAWVSAHIVTETVPILGAVTCNKVIFPQLKAALQEVIDRGLADKIHPSQYAGCYYPRFIAGTTTLSNHAFGLALDLNAVENQRGTVGQIDRGVVSAFEHWGFTWGGSWSYTDPMHFEMNSVVSPQVAAKRGS
jgi:hypothetical protein